MADHVQITGIPPRIQYVANGSQTSFEYPFALFKSENMKVYLNDILQDSTTYTVSGAGTTGGGTVMFTTAPTQNTIVTLVRVLDIERTTDFQEGGALRASALNYELDYQIACQQQIADNLNRSMVLPPYAADINVNLTLPTPDAGKAIVWNADGTNLENSRLCVNEIADTMTAQVATATEKAATATAAAQTATEKATIATEKAAEAVSTVGSKMNTGLDNITAAGKASVMNWCMPDYSNRVQLEWNTEYVATENGVVTFNAFCDGSSHTVYVNINGQELFYTDDNKGIGPGWTGGPHQAYFGMFFIVGKGDTYKVYGGSGHQMMYFYPMKGEAE